MPSITLYLLPPPDFKSFTALNLRFSAIELIIILRRHYTFSRFSAIVNLSLYLNCPLFCLYQINVISSFQSQAKYQFPPGSSRTLCPPSLPGHCVSKARAPSPSVFHCALPLCTLVSQCGVYLSFHLFYSQNSSRASGMC